MSIETQKEVIQMGKSRRGKHKSGNRTAPQKLILVAALVNLITALVALIDRLLE
jgi:hypothetical protein